MASLVFPDSNMIGKCFKKAGINADIKRWWRWNKSISEEKPHLSGIGFSFLMCILGYLFWVLRRLSLFEQLKHYLFDPLGKDPKEAAPAWFADLQVTLVSGMIYIGPLLIPNDICKSYLLVWFAGWLVLQTIQITAFQLLWKSIIKPRDTINPYSHVRNLWYVFNSYFQIIWLFGVIYWFGFRNDFASHICPKHLFDCIYYSAVTATTIGYGDMYPGSTNMRIVVILQIISSVFMATIILGRAIGSIRVLPEYRDNGNGSDES